MKKILTTLFTLSLIFVQSSYSLCPGGRCQVDETTETILEHIKTKKIS